VTAAGGPPAEARVTSPVIVRHAAVSWGLNSQGQLGNGTTDEYGPYGEVSGLDSDVVQVAAGFSHGLGVISDGTVRAWGDNTYGQLGDGTQTERSTPVQVTGLTGVIRRLGQHPRPARPRGPR
jgi:alpha-tubulin suppressor-like RCC1 family protein